MHICESDPRLIKQINKNKGRQVSCFSALIAEHLVVRRKRVHQVIPLLLLSNRWYHPYLGFMCLVHKPENTYFWYKNELIFVSFHELYWFGNGSFSFLAMCAEEERNNSWQKPFQLSQLSVTSSLALCHLRTDGTSAFRERILPLLDTCPCSDQIRQVVAWWEGAPVVPFLLKFNWVVHVFSNLLDLCVWAGQTQLGFVDKLAWAWF